MLPWLVNALKYSYLDKRILNAARVLLAKERFTRNLTFLGVLDDLQDDMVHMLEHLGHELKTLYNTQNLSVELGDSALSEVITMHPTLASPK